MNDSTAQKVSAITIKSSETEGAWSPHAMSLSRRQRRWLSERSKNVLWRRSKGVPMSQRVVVVVVVVVVARMILRVHPFGCATRVQSNARQSDKTPDEATLAGSLRGRSHARRR